MSGQPAGQLWHVLHPESSMPSAVYLHCRGHGTNEPAMGLLQGYSTPLAGLPKLPNPQVVYQPLRDLLPSIGPASQPGANPDDVLPGWFDAQLAVAGGGAVDLAGRDAQVPGQRLQCPVGKVTELVLQEM